MDESKGMPEDVVNGTAGILTKFLALVDIYAFAGHPGIYLNLWHQRMWYFGVPLILIAPMALYWAASVLWWRVRVDPATIRLVSVRGVVQRPITDITQVEFHKGNLAIGFVDGRTRVIRMFVRNLDKLCSHIERCLQEQHGPNGPA